MTLRAQSERWRAGGQLSSRCRRQTGSSCSQKALQPASASGLSLSAVIARWMTAGGQEKSGAPPSRSQASGKNPTVMASTSPGDQLAIGRGLGGVTEIASSGTSASGVSRGGPSFSSMSVPWRIAVTATSGEAGKWLMRS